MNARQDMIACSCCVGLALAVLVVIVAKGLAKNQQPETTSESSKVYNSGRLATEKHDGHLFILDRYSSKGAIIHHPDCPCGKSN